MESISSKDIFLPMKDVLLTANPGLWSMWLQGGLYPVQNAAVRGGIEPFKLADIAMVTT